MIKIHPANVVKGHRDGVTQNYEELRAIEDTLGNVPSHIKVLLPDSDISTISLFPIMDYCLTVRGTVGIEAACRGIRVLTAGTGRYDRLGFTLDFQSPDTYLEALERLQNIESMDDSESELARRYAYGEFLLRTIPITSVSFGYRADADATLDSTLNVCGDKNLSAAPDVKHIADWIASDDFDCCIMKIDNHL